MRAARASRCRWASFVHATSRRLRCNLRSAKRTTATDAGSDEPTTIAATAADEQMTARSAATEIIDARQGLRRENEMA
jgi:hypothetical protein